MGQFDFDLTEEEKLGQNNKLEKSHGKRKMFITFLKFMGMVVATIVFLYFIKINYYKKSNYGPNFQDLVNNRYNS